MKYGKTKRRNGLAATEGQQAHFHRPVSIEQTHKQTQAAQLEALSWTGEIINGKEIWALG